MVRDNSLSHYRLAWRDGSVPCSLGHSDEMLTLLGRGGAEYDIKEKLALRVGLKMILLAWESKATQLGAPVLLAVVLPK